MQVVEITELMGAYLQRYYPSPLTTAPPIVEEIPFAEVTENMRTTLLLMAALPNQVGDYLRTQLTEYEAYLAAEQAAGQTRGVDFSELLPYAATVMAFLRAEINFSVQNGKVDFSVNVAFVSLATLVNHLKGKKLVADEPTVKNSVTQSTIDAQGNVHIGDKIYYYREEGESLE